MYIKQKTHQTSIFALIGFQNAQLSRVRSCELARTDPLTFTVLRLCVLAHVSTGSTNPFPG